MYNFVAKICMGTDQLYDLLPVLGEIFYLVIDNVICSQGAYRFQFPRTAHRGDFIPKRFGDLHGKCSAAAGCAINQNLLFRLSAPFYTHNLSQFQEQGS